MPTHHHLSIYNHQHSLNTVTWSTAVQRLIVCINFAMCLWLVTACLGVLPVQQQVIVGVPAPILQPTAAPTTTTTTTTTTTMRPPPTTTPPPQTTQACCNQVRVCVQPSVVCLANPNNYGTGSLIDPRLGSTPPGYSQQITGYSAPLPSYDSAVRFPQKRSIRRDRSNDTKELEENDANMAILQRQKRQTSCTCVAAGTCPSSTTSGAGMIDFRIVTPVSVHTYSFE